MHQHGVIVLGPMRIWKFSFTLSIAHMQSQYLARMSLCRGPTLMSSIPKTCAHAGSDICTGGHDSHVNSLQLYHVLKDIAVECSTHQMAQRVCVCLRAGGGVCRCRCNPDITICWSHYGLAQEEAGQGFFEPHEVALASLCVSTL